MIPTIVAYRSLVPLMHRIALLGVDALAASMACIIVTQQHGVIVSVPPFRFLSLNAEQARKRSLWHSAFATIYQQEPSTLVSATREDSIR